MTALFWTVVILAAAVIYTAVIAHAYRNWDGAAVRTATSRNMIHLVGQHRSTHPSRKGSLLAVWMTSHNAQ